MTWSKLVGSTTTSFEGQLLTSNIDPSSLAWITSPGVRAKWRTIQRFSGVADTLWSDDETVAGHPAFVTTSLSSTSGAVLADWSKCLVGFFGPSVRVIVNPFQYGLQDRIMFVVECLCDVAVTRAEAFAVAADSMVA